MDDCHVLLVIFPGQGHINPSLQFAKRLVNLGAKVTLSTGFSAMNRMSSRPEIQGLDFAPFSDGYDAGLEPADLNDFWASIKTRGSDAVAKLITAKKEEGRPFTRLIYTTVMSWAGVVARGLHVPVTLLWIQPATVLDIYYHYFTEYGDLFRNCSGKNRVVEVPGVPPLGVRDFPSFLFSTETNVNYDLDWAIEAMGDQIEEINGEENPKVLVNTFDALEFDALRAIKKVRMVGIGPLIPSAYLDGKDPSDTAFGGDLRQNSSNDYVEWLDSQPKSSVVYLAFGSYADAPNTMLEEIAQGLVKTKVPFLWVLRETSKGEKPEEKLRCKEELEEQGKIVRWCAQVEVLQHPSIGCFLTHCGWNSTLESLASGVPLVACPLWNDQFSNAKLIQDVWKLGMRVSANEEGVVEADEYKRCIECVMGGGEKGEELRKNAKKWKELAKGAMKEDGSSYLNLKAYMDEMLCSP
ncbi:PREDICTED: crocetin glucosyltransferase, chloroplastic-like [Ipomoea nil]|uniref:crocetin glucosyltransferase, chloroplastic-like n=1 Tax=Ipomoea nil TaxID=35883 RepID=UPI000900E401|nr:PREDICTED: crocetin glucosyltransferase, chloroplastic-like [Ipomoea nil]